MTKQKYECIYAESRGNIRYTGGGVYCRISDKNCEHVKYEVPFGAEVIDRMNECPAYNIPKDLAKALISAKTDLEKSEINKKKSNLEKKL